MSDLVRRLHRADQDPGCGPELEALCDEAAEEITRLTAEVDRLESDELAYRLALGYEIPANHGGLLSDGTQPVNGIAQAYGQQYERLQAVVDAVEEEIARIREECLDNYHRSSFDKGQLDAIEQIQRAISEKRRALDGEP